MRMWNLLFFEKEKRFFLFRHTCQQFFRQIPEAMLHGHPQSGEPCSPHLVFRWCSPLALRAMLGGLDGLTDEERGPCPLSVAQPPLLVEPCSVARRARQGEPCSPHLVFRWCSPPCLSSHARWLGWAHRCEERAMPSVWVPARRLVWIVSTGFPVLDLSWYLHACRPFNIMRASLIPFNHQSWS